MLARKDYLDKIISNLAWLKSHVEIAKNLNLLDINIHSEMFFCDLFNLVYSYHLINMNSIQKNYNTIDLGDTRASIAIQITSDNSREKIENTIEGFIDNKLYKTYNRLIIFILGNKKEYRKTFDTKGCFNFNKIDDIMDINSLIDYIHTVTTKQLSDISEFLNQEIPDKKTTFIDKTNAISDMLKYVYILCLSKLKAIGIKDEIAQCIIEDDINSEKYTYVLDSAEHGKNYLIGDFGTGKSHTILVLVQRLIRKYLQKKLNCLPLFIQANELTRKKNTVQEWATSILLTDRYFIFIDGLDEISYDQADKIIEEITFLKEFWPQSRFILGSRPTSLLVSNPCAISIAKLSEEEKYKLYCIVLGSEQSLDKNPFIHLDKVLDTLLSNPFFCIIYALNQDDANASAQTDMDLVTFFMNKSLEPLKLRNHSIYMQLEKLAAVTVDKGLGLVHQTEIEANIGIEELLRTGFIVKTTDGYIEFPLPIIAQWLAADSIRHGFINITKILEDDELLINWRYSLSILLSQLTFEESLDFFAKIVLRAPGIASIIIRDGIRFGYSQNLKTAHECGRAIRKCMQIWVDSLGALSKLIAPVGENGLYALGLYVEGANLSFTWANRDLDQEILVLPEKELLFWGGSLHSRSVPAQATWPWIITFDHLSKQLEKLVKSKSVLIPDGAMSNEYIWNTTLRLSGKGSLYEQSIKIDTISHYRQFIGKDYFISRGHRIDLDSYFYFVDRLLNKGFVCITPPYPISDMPRTGGAIWKPFSRDALLKRETYVHSSALSEYKRLVENTFDSLCGQMSTFTLLPGKLVGYLDFQRNNSGGDPYITWYIEALPSNQISHVDIKLRHFARSQMTTLFEQLHRNNVMNRPTKHKWCHTIIHSQFLIDLSSATPVTDLVYNWIAKDLHEIGWI